MTMTGFSNGQANMTQIVAIMGVDAASNTATGLTRNQVHVTIDLSYHVGSVHVTPSVGEQWNIKRFATPRGTPWVLDSKIPFNTVETLEDVTEGQQQVGNGNGPVQLHGNQVNSNGPLRLVSPDIIAEQQRRRGIRGDASLPDATTTDAGSLAYDGTVPTYTDGTTWNPLATADQVQSKYTLPADGVPTTDLSTGVQSALTLAQSALQNIPTNSVGANQLQSGAVGTAQLAAPVQTAITKANTALQSLSGSPYDLSIVAFGATSGRSIGSGDNPFGIKIQRACTLTSVSYRGASADASGNLVVELRRNGTTIPSTSATIAAANQVTPGGTLSFSQICNAGDILTVYVTNVGATPGVGLVADITGVMN